jgi:hypothetical protein
LFGEKRKSHATILIHEYLRKTKQKNSCKQEGKEEEGDDVTAAMIATTVEKGVTVGQWAFAVFEDDRNDCTSL